MKKYSEKDMRGFYVTVFNSYRRLGYIKSDIAKLRHNMNYYYNPKLAKNDNKKLSKDEFVYLNHKINYIFSVLASLDEKNLEDKGHIMDYHNYPQYKNSKDILIGNDIRIH